MNEFAHELIAIARCFGSFERLAICCGRVTVQQCVALQSLLDGGKDTGSLADCSGVSSSAMTRLVDGLEDRRWVRRVRSSDDQRRVVVELTAAGRREAERLVAQTVEMSKLVLARIPREKRAEVLSSIRLVRTALESVASEGRCLPEASLQE